MMQRKNKSRNSTTGSSGYGSGYESNDNNINTINNNQYEDKTKSSPSKPPVIHPSNNNTSSGISIGALTGHNTNKSEQLSNSYHRKPSKGGGGGGVAGGGGVVTASVKRNKCGTQPFDQNWLNLDCCGLICAGLTYMLHMYGVYSFGWILLPPWFSVMDDDGYRELTFGCHLHRTLFITIAFLAVYAHFKAMTTDPGAVPPDANPLPEGDNVMMAGNNGAAAVGTTTTTTTTATGGLLGTAQNLDELDNLIKGENNHHHHNHSSSLMQQDSQQQQHSSSSLMQEDQQSLLSNNNTNSNTGRIINKSINGLPQAVATTAVGAVGAAAVVGVGAVGVGAAAIARGAVAMAGAGGANGSNNNNGAASSLALGAGAPMKSATAAAVPKKTPSQQQQRGRRMCRRCQAFKPPRAHHCSICKRCIIKMDHHCPWVNNCVGIGNHKYFLLFIFYTSLSCAYSFTFLVYRCFHCIGPVHSHRHIHNGPRCVDHPTDLLPLVGLAVEALLFGLFTMCMMVDQWDVVMTNLTHIDRLKGETTMGHHHHHHGANPYQQQQQQQHAGAYGQLPSHMTPHYNPQHAQNLMKQRASGINEVFGTVRQTMSTSRFHYTWLSPLHKVCFPETVRNDIFGYCRPCGGGGGGGGSGSSSSIKSMEMVGRGRVGDGGGRAAIGAAEIV